jgi:hypothetical protein
MKRSRSDSAAAAVAAAQAAAEGPLRPPAQVVLRDVDMPYWDAIILARARDTWTVVDLVKAANLARCQSEIERVTELLQDAPDTVLNGAGTPIVNPLHTLVETLTRREIALSRAIHVHAEATVGKSEDAGKKLATEKKARQALQATDDGLIPGRGAPVH